MDVGTGTQDILLFDPDLGLENAPRLVMPSPTVVAAGRIREATRAGLRVVVTGLTAGGGPCHWAVMEHLRAGLEVLATAEAARTFDDDLEKVEEMGVKLVSEEEARGAEGVRIRLADLWLEEVLATLASFGAPAPEALAVAVFDHGNAPPGTSDRVFRFRLLQGLLGKRGDLADLAFRREGIPAEMTRMQAVARSAPEDLPLMVMDTAPAAVLGGLQDPARLPPAEDARRVLVNLGNFHTVAYVVEGERVLGFLEHHTGELTPARLSFWVRRLARGEISFEEVFRDMGHGAAILAPWEGEVAVVGVTGPRRGLVRGSGLICQEVAPFGDLMHAGNYGLLAAFAAHFPEAAERIRACLAAT